VTSASAFAMITGEETALRSRATRSQVAFRRHRDLRRASRSYHGGGNERPSPRSRRRAEARVRTPLRGGTSRRGARSSFPSCGPRDRDHDQPVRALLHHVFNPVLALDRSPATRWLTAFFLPAYGHLTRSGLECHPDAGSVAFIVGAPPSSRAPSGLRGQAPAGPATRASTP
jgi:hypothetical protein